MPHTVRLRLLFAIRGACLGKTKYSHAHTCTHTQTHRQIWAHNREKYFLPLTSLALTASGILAWSRSRLLDSLRILSRQRNHRRTPDSQTKFFCFNLICLVSVFFYANTSTANGLGSSPSISCAINYTFLKCCLAKICYESCEQYLQIVQMSQQNTHDSCILTFHYNKCGNRGYHS